MRFRDDKNLQKGQYYHVFNRGNNKGLTFLEPLDFHSFIKRLKTVLDIPTGAPLKMLKPLPKDAFTLYAYCLMPNHFHLLIKQNTELPISKLIHKVCTSYSMYFNRRHGHTGHVFQDRFKAKLVENDSYFIYLSAYINNNPDDPLNYKYSSFREILGKEKDDLCDKNFILKMFQNNPKNYEMFVLGIREAQKQKIENLEND